MSDDLELVQVNTTAAVDHMGEIERAIRVVKERARSLISNLPFTSFQKQIVIHLVYFLVLWLKTFLATKGI